MRPWLGWHRPSWRVLVGIGLGILGLAALVGGYAFWSAAQQRRAMDAYAAALSRVSEARAPQAAPELRAAAVRRLEAVLAEYPSGTLAPTAAWELGNLRYEARDWGRARAAYEMAQARAQSATLRTLTRAAIGYTWEAEGNWAQAIGAYRGALAGLRPGEFLWDELVVDVGRAQELAGQTADAIETYRQLLQRAPQSPRADDVRSRLAHLGAGP